MKKIACILFLGLFLIVPTTWAKPPSWSESLNKPTITKPLVTRELRPTKIEIKKGLTEKRKEQIRKYFNQMVKRFETAIARLEKLIFRIDSRLAKLEKAGNNISGIKTEVQSAKTKLAKAKSDLSSAQTQLETALASENPKQAFAQVKALIKGIKSQLIEVHRVLVHTIGEIKGLRTGQITATPTP